MSPAGLTSACAGSTGRPAPPDDDEPPQPAIPRASRAPATVRKVRMAGDPRRRRSAPGQREVNARSEVPAAAFRAPAAGYRRRVAAPAILLVEDDEAIASGLVRVLDAQGYAVRRLARGGPALASATPDVGLVVLDLGLPDV